MVILLPGVPFEMRKLIEHEVAPRLAARGGSADWPCLLLVKRRRYGYRRKERAFHRADPADASFGSW